MQVLRGIGHF